jgi:hypothetical protein
MGRHDARHGQHAVVEGRHCVAAHFYGQDGDMTQGFFFRPLATFRGLKAVPLVALSFNSLFPSLVVRPGGLTLRVIRRHDFAFADIAEIDVTRWLTYRIEIIPRHGIWIFSANVLNRREAVRILLALQQQNAPLSARTAQFTRDDGSTPTNRGL